VHNYGMTLEFVYFGRWIGSALTHPLKRNLTPANVKTLFDTNLRPRGPLIRENCSEQPENCY